MNGAIRIRKAGPQDAAAIGRIYVDAWRETYAGMLPDKILIRMSARSQASRWSRQLSRRSGSEIVLVAATDGEVVGFGSAGPTRAGGREGEIYTLYVDPNFQGRGIGRALMKGLLAALESGGFRSALVWVVAANPARFFYEVMGGKRVAEKTERLWGMDLEQFAYRWSFE